MKCNRGTEQECNWGHGDYKRAKKCNRVFLQGLLECTCMCTCMAYSWAWEFTCSYKINHQPVCEWVTASNSIMFRLVDVYYGAHYVAKLSFGLV